MGEDPLGDRERQTSPSTSSDVGTARSSDVGATESSDVAGSGADPRSVVGSGEGALDDTATSLDGLAEMILDRAGDDIDTDRSLETLVDDLDLDAVSPDGSLDPTALGVEDAAEPSSTDADGWAFDSPASSFGATDPRPWRDGPADPADVLDALSETDGSDSDDVEDLPTARNVLLVGGLDDHACTDHCVDLLCAPDQTAVNVLYVAVSGDVDDRLSSWESRVGAYPVNAGFVAVGGRGQPSGSSAVIETRAGPDRITVDGVADPADLTRLGITLTRRLEEWESNPYPTVLCVDSLTELLQYVELRRLFRFIHVLQNTLVRVDGLAHYHLDPNAHDTRTVRLFETLVEDSVHVED